MNTGSRTQQEQQFRKIVETHQDRVLNTCYRFLKSREDAQDVAQEVFIQVYKSLDEFRGDAQLSTWIYRIAVTKSLDFIRRQNRQRRMGSVKTLLGFGSEVIEVADTQGITPERDLDDQERQKILAWAVSKLPESQRVAITLSNYEDYSNREIAEIMRTSVSAVESLLHRGRKNLEKRLWKYFASQMNRANAKERI